MVYFAYRSLLAVLCACGQKPVNDGQSAYPAKTFISPDGTKQLVTYPWHDGAPPDGFEDSSAHVLDLNKNEKVILHKKAPWWFCGNDAVFTHFIAEDDNGNTVDCGISVYNISDPSIPTLNFSFFEQYNALWSKSEPFVIPGTQPLPEHERVRMVTENLVGITYDVFSEQYIILLAEDGLPVYQNCLITVYFFDENGNFTKSIPTETGAMLDNDTNAWIEQELKLDKKGNLFFVGARVRPKTESEIRPYDPYDRYAIIREPHEYKLNIHTGE